MLLQSQT